MLSTVIVVWQSGAAPTALDSGDYQWRASAWVAEIDQWTEFSETLLFEVRSETIGLSRVSPSVIASLPNEQQQVEIEGWGFLPGTTVVIESPPGSKTLNQQTSYIAL